MKKLISWVMALTMLISASGFSGSAAFAADIEDSQSEEIILPDKSEWEIAPLPRWSNLNMVYNSLNFSGGNAVLGADAYGYYQNQKLSMTVTLQKQPSTSSSFSNVASWSSSGMGSASVSKSYSVSSGAYYRLKIDIKIYNSSGSLIETINTIYSTSKYY